VVGWTFTTDPIEVVGFTLLDDNLSNGAGLVVRGSSHLIEGNTIKGKFRYGIRLVKASRTTLLGNRVFGTRSAISLANSTHNRLLNNFVSGAGGTPAIEILGGWSNTMAGNACFTSGTYGAVGIRIKSSPNNVLENNTVSVDGAEGSSALRVESTKGVTVKNCILSGPDYGIAAIDSSAITVTYSIVRGFFNIGGTGVVVGPGVLLGVAPLLVSPFEGDLRLQRGSPARDTGVGKDRDGTQADMGAYGGIY
jgi:parallel beta-helix repeat protein